tara:strand:+ start:124 stop:426 length:303 start_codon:yes stop_codon:yes gene_type:complete
MSKDESSKEDKRRKRRSLPYLKKKQADIKLIGKPKKLSGGRGRKIIHHGEEVSFATRKHHKGVDTSEYSKKEWNKIKRKLSREQQRKLKYKLMKKGGKAK